MATYILKNSYCTATVSHDEGLERFLREKGWMRKNGYSCTTLSIVSFSGHTEDHLGKSVSWAKGYFKYLGRKYGFDTTGGWKKKAAAPAHDGKHDKPKVSSDV